MTPLPKRRHSTRRGGKRTAALKLPFLGLVKCSNCGKFCLPHRMCKFCGYYDKREIVKQTIKKAKKS